MSAGCVLGYLDDVVTTWPYYTSTYFGGRLVGSSILSDHLVSFVFNCFVKGFTF